MADHYPGAVIAAVLLTTCLVAVLLTGVSRRYALRRSLLDIPNDRSSHSVPTPRGGGVAIAVTLAVGVSVLGWLGMVQSKLVWAWLGFGLGKQQNNLAKAHEGKSTKEETA